MKRFFVIIVTLLVANSVWAQNFKKDGLYYHYDSISNTLSVNKSSGYSGDIIIPEVVSEELNILDYIESTIVMNCENSEYGSFYTFDKGVLTKAQLGDVATNVIFCFQILDDNFHFISGTESVNEIVKTQASETNFVMIDKSTLREFNNVDWTEGKSAINISKKLEWDSKRSVAFKNAKCEGFFEVVTYDYQESLTIKVWLEKKNNVSFVAPVTSIVAGAFNNCTELTSVTIPESINEIGEGAFNNCTGLKSITIPKNVTTIAAGAFNNCTELSSVTIPESVKEIRNGAFQGCTSLKSITIPNNVTTIGNTAFSGCTNLSNAYFNAENCAMTTAFNNMGSIKEVSFGNDVTSIPEALFSGCSAIGSIIIPNNVVTIEASAFENCTKLKELTIGANCNSIGENAFSGCSRLIDITCYAEDVPLANENSFANYNGYLHIPCEYVRWYKADNIFGQFANTECIPSRYSELHSDKVAVIPEINNAVFSMPINESANSYTLTIQNNGVTFCTLTFNSQGQLANIDFSTTKSYELKAGVSAYQFTVTGLSEATNYGYSFKALASNKSVLKEYTGSFTTKNADGTGGSSSGGGEGSLAVDNISANNAVTIANNQILVNGEAPAFVTNISGQKIANQNLKSGVYFVNVEGETVKVVLK